MYPKTFKCTVKNSELQCLLLENKPLKEFYNVCTYYYTKSVLIKKGQLAYGAVILSFLGGVRWGKLVTPGSPIQSTWGQYSWSVTPSLIAWPALMIPSLPISSLIVASGLGLSGYLDIKQSGYASWFKGLRIVLTTVAILSLLSTLILSYILDIQTEEKETVHTIPSI